MIYRFENHTPKINPDAFVADSADIIGQVEILAGASIWFNCVLRGDNDLIHIGRNSNIQDGSVIHTDKGSEVRIAEHVTAGHRVVLHGCQVASHCLIGINSVLLNDVEVESWCLIGANALVTGGQRIPERSLVLGSPAKVVRTLTDAECRLIEESSQSYANKSVRFPSDLEAIISRE
ncbi:MAG: gamma carbonic anhydrase family protein [marine bacterium B5-7]|nr:MAG: gamma carbonic anhydrase family protein [marine bacterium B5-7]